MAEIASNEVPVLTALQNELILDKIFEHLPVKSLLGCSEVCRIWNNQVRTYIRDHRKCTVSISSASSPCSRLRELDQVIGDMNIVPFNSIQFHLEPHEVCLFHENNGRCAKKPRMQVPDDGLSCRNLFTRMKLKHLTIRISPSITCCPAMYLLFRILLEKKHEITDLKVLNVSRSFMDVFVDTQPLELQALERLQVGTAPSRNFERGRPIRDLRRMDGRQTRGWQPMDGQKTLDFLEKILHGSTPKLKQIFDYTVGRKFTKILPVNKYKLLSNYGFNKERVGQAVLLADSRPSLSELSVQFQNVRDHQPPFEYNHIIQSFIQSSLKSIVKLELSPMCFAKVLEFPALENLISLKIGGCGKPEETRNSLQSIQLGRLFPNLQKLELIGNELDWMSYTGIELELVAPHPEFYSEVDAECLPESPYASQTTSDLIVHADMSSVSFVNLKKSLPEVMDLLIIADPTNAHTVPYRQIFRLWPNLKRLHVRGSIKHPVSNYDAEFCGINQEEVELLWSMDDDYLKNVHIVPVRPGVTTMPSELNDLAGPSRLNLIKIENI